MNQKLYIIVLVLLCAIMINYYFLKESFTDSGEIKDSGVAKMVSTMGTQVKTKEKAADTTTESIKNTIKEVAKETTKESSPIYITQEALDSQLALQQKLMESETKRMIQGEMLTRRATDQPRKSKTLGSYKSDPSSLNPKKALQQGSAYQSLTKDPKVVCPSIDPSKYIKRDQIPCWNCNLMPGGK